MFVNLGGGVNHTGSQAIRFFYDAECSETEKYVFCWHILRIILILACLLLKDICKLKSSTEENTYTLGLLEGFRFLKSKSYVLDHSGYFDMTIEELKKKIFGGCS